jgi:hypothetical protein
MDLIDIEPDIGAIRGEVTADVSDTQIVGVGLQKEMHGHQGARNQYQREKQLPPPVVTCVREALSSTCSVETPDV